MSVEVIGEVAVRVLIDRVFYLEHKAHTLPAVTCELCADCSLSF